uniref:Uncharacterized protein n=1 Tax=Ciona savignyi TaxID=51511 RepID=H2Z2P6_CIOSA
MFGIGLTDPTSHNHSKLQDLSGVSNLTTSSAPESPEQGGMELNITAGVFMILMIAIVTALLLCCCKTYVVCQKRRRRQRAWERNLGVSERGDRSLPSIQRYGDQPPSYSDVFFGRPPSRDVESTADLSGTISNNNTEPKDPEDTIAVYWSYHDVSNDPPPVYPCVVIENDAAITEQPPGYETCSRATPAGGNTRPNGGRERSRATLTGVSRAVLSAIQSVSGLMDKPRHPPRRPPQTRPDTSNQPTTSSSNLPN